MQEKHIKQLLRYKIRVIKAKILDRVKLPGNNKEKIVKAYIFYDQLTRPGEILHSARSIVQESSSQQTT